MGRPFDFSPRIIQEARLRQGGFCACCGDSLDDVVEHAHHVVPNQSGDKKNAEHAWLKSTDNCVVVCDNCHYRVHENGRYQSGAVAQEDYFPHAHKQSNRNSHNAWKIRVQNFTGKLWVT